MASKKGNPNLVPKIHEKLPLLPKQVQSLAVPDIRLMIENVLGMRVTIPVSKTTTIGDIKSFLSRGHKIPAASIDLVAKLGYPPELIRLENAKSIEEYGLTETTRILMVPLLRSGDVDDDGDKVFVGNGDEGERIVNRLLEEHRKKRDPNCRHLLTQESGSKPGEYQLFEVPVSASSSDSTSDLSDRLLDQQTEEPKLAMPRPLIESELKQNQRAKAAMKSLLVRSKKKSSTRKSGKKENGLKRKDGNCKQQ